MALDTIWGGEGEVGGEVEKVDVDGGM